MSLVLLDIGYGRASHQSCLRSPYTYHPHLPASRLLEKGLVKPMVEPAVPKVPMDYTWAKRLGLVRKPANFISSISDDRGDELRSVVCESGQVKYKTMKNTNPAEAPNESMSELEFIQALTFPTTLMVSI